MKKWGIFLFAFMFSIVLLSYNSPAPIKTKAALGKKLFSDKILSKDNSISCASCHIPSRGFSDTLAFSIGIEGIPTLRNTPSVLNMKNRPYFFWDGRATTLEQQALMPIEHKHEMGLTIVKAVKRLQQSNTYSQLFKNIFGTAPSTKTLSMAIAAFENTLETDDSKFDLSFDDKNPLSASEERGRKLFTGDKAKCFDCHNGPDFTNDEFKNIGLYDGINLIDEGRYTITKEKEDLGKFKTPGLRNIDITAPYMHNGMFTTLEQVVDYYNNPTSVIKNPINIDSSLLKPLGLTNEEKKDLINFMKALTDKRFENKAF
jgi:cytochrome c peroxidase